MDYKIQKPFLKWVGGKTQIIGNIINNVPKNINNYHEIFLGGGSVLLAILSLKNNNMITIKKNIYAYDLNSTLINVYKDIQNNKDNLYKYIQKYIKEYESCKTMKIKRTTRIKINPQSLKEAKLSKEHYYYWMRNRFNSLQDTVEKSALFIILNKTCFRGLYREGPNGFNVPFGNYKTMSIISKEELDNISKLIKDVKFVCLDFSESLKNIKKGDFVYLDPPYYPENDKSFVKYTKLGFNFEKHKNLFTLINKLNNKKAKFMLSNAKVNYVVEFFKKYHIKDVECRRAINSKNPASKTTEVIICN